MGKNEFKAGGGTKEPCDELESHQGGVEIRVLSC